MLWIVLIVTVIVFIGVLLRYGNTDGYYDLGDVLAGIWWSAVVSIATGLVMIALTSVAANIVLPHHDRYDRLVLIAIKDGTEQSGSFVLIAGTVGTNEKYRFYYREPDGAVRLTNQDAASVKLYEDSVDPYAIRYVGCTLEHDWAPCLEFSAGSIQEIHVPRGSVKTQIDLTLNK